MRIGVKDHGISVMACHLSYLGSGETGCQTICDAVMAKLVRCHHIDISRFIRNVVTTAYLSKMVVDSKY